MRDFTPLEAAALDLYLTEPPEHPDVCEGCKIEGECGSMSVCDDLLAWCEECWDGKFDPRRSVA